jgi:TonB family protein
MRVRAVLMLDAILLAACPKPAVPYLLSQDAPTRNDGLIEAAKKGDARSQCELAKFYLEKRKIRDAVAWFKKAAGQGFAEAQGWMGALYDAGQGVSRNYERAEELYRKAAEQGDVSAQVNLGFMYQHGRNVPQPVRELNGSLIFWSDNGGGFVRQDFAEAAKWYLRSAQQGSSFAQSRLGWMYIRGLGVKKDGSEAAKWFLKAAEQGETSTQCMLSALYLDGESVPTDYIQAHRWLNLCVAGMPGEKRKAAAKLLDDITAQMTQQQIEEAKLLARMPDQGVAQKSSQGPYYVGMGVTPPLMLIAPAPNYTEEARVARAKGIVNVQCIIRRDGTVGGCKVLRELGYGLDESAVNTIEARWRFKPGSLNGEPVDVVIIVETTFRL